MDFKGVIVTFSCQQAVHVFPKDCSVRPTPPYKMHSTVKIAKDFLKERRGIKKPKTVTHK